MAPPSRCLERPAWSGPPRASSPLWRAPSAASRRARWNRSHHSARLGGQSQKFGVNIVVANGSTPEARAPSSRATEVVLCTAKAGVRVLDASEIAGAAKLLVAADVNAVPPSGIEGVDAHANGTPLRERGALGIGALAIGNVNVAAESGLFKQMTESKAPLRLDVRQALDLARTLAWEGWRQCPGHSFNPLGQRGRQNAHQQSQKPAHVGSRSRPRPGSHRACGH